MARKANGTVVEAPVAAETEEKNPLLDAARKVLLAGIGAVGLAQDEVEDFVQRLVERGEIAEHDARKLVREIADRRRKGATTEIDHRIEDLLNRMDIPTKTDIKALSLKIAAMTEKVEELKKEKAAKA